VNASAFRHFYEYHFRENRKIWESYVACMSYDQFTQPAAYSHGSVRDQLIHLMDVEDAWFSELQNLAPLEPVPPASSDDRDVLRLRWDRIEQRMRAYLAGLQDDMLSSKPIIEPEEDQDLATWQVLLHVANHATDHRAQLLRQLNDLGVETEPQDYIFFVYDNL